MHRLVIPNIPTTFELPGSASPETIEEVKLLHKIAKCTSGTRFDEAASYLLAALASRPGDGRRRTIEELISALRVTCELDTAQQLKSATQAAKVIQQFITPPADWAARETFFVPSRDLLQAFAQLNAHKVLDAAICAVSTAHPLGLEATVKMCEPLETIIRKGLPLVKNKGTTPPDAVVTKAIPSGKPDIATESGASVLAVEEKEPVTADSSKAAAKDNGAASNEPLSVSGAAAVGKVDGTSMWELTPPPSVPIVGSPLRERGDTIDSHDSGSALRGVGAELEHLSEDPHHLMIGADQRMTNGDSSDEHDSDDDGDEHDSDEDDEEEDDEEDDDDLEEDDDDDEDQDSEDYEHDRDDVHNVNNGGVRASFNFNVEGVNVSGRLSPRCPDDEDDDDHEHDRMDDDAGEEDDEDEDADHNLNINDDDDEIMDGMFDMADDEDHGEEDEDEDEDGENMGAADRKSVV